MSNPVLSAIAERRSIRVYEDRNLSREEIDTLLRAAQEAPSAGNRQPWHFSIVQNRGILQEINEEAARVMEKDPGDIFFKAPLAIFLSCDAASRWGRLDCGIATGTIALAAHSLGLGSVILGRPDAAFSGPREDYFNKLLQFPEGYRFAVAIAVGHPGATKEAHPIEPGRITFVD
jgi:nitroreductase